MSVPNLKATTYRAGQKITCPHCQSTQVKAMANQPRKYPYPEDNFLTPTKELEALRELWNKGYDCKKCGNEFIAIEWHMTPSWETAPPEQSINVTIAPKKRGFFKTLLLLIFWLVIGLIVLGFIFGKEKTHEQASQSIEKQENVADQELKPLNNNPMVTTEITPEQQPIEQEEFTPQAEEDAHSYTPTQSDYQNIKPEEKPESISDSQNQNDTLSIKTTLRNKSE